jgi:hypothetical protein
MGRLERLNNTVFQRILAPKVLDFVGAGGRNRTDTSPGDTGF